MKVAKLGAAALGLIAAAVSAQASEHTNWVADAMPAIRRANSEWSEAMKSGDVDVIAKPYAIDAVFVTADGNSIRGRTAIKDFYRSRLNGKAPVVSATILRRGAAVGDDGLVYEWGVGTVVVRSSGGALETRGGPYLTVWKREGNGQWEIIRNVVL
jgi:uncharacterized protein (TIGR02246 family)